jgi:hypothetical protein
MNFKYYTCVTKQLCIVFKVACSSHNNNNTNNNRTQES